MSLLMDALKRAERARRTHTAERKRAAHDERHGSEGFELRIDSLEDERTSDDSGSMQRRETSSGRGRRGAAGETFGAEAPGDETPGDETPGDETPGDETPGDETPGDETLGEAGHGGEALALTPLAGEDEPEHEEPAKDEETTGQLGRLEEDFSPAEAKDSAEKGLAGDRPAPGGPMRVSTEPQHTAYTVFAAKRRRAGWGAGPWLLAALVVAVVTSLAGVGYYYWEMLSSEPRLVQRTPALASVTAAPDERNAGSQSTPPTALSEAGAGRGESGPAQSGPVAAGGGSAAGESTVADEPDAPKTTSGPSASAATGEAKAPSFGSFSVAELAQEEPAQGGGAEDSAATSGRVPGAGTGDPQDEGEASGLAEETQLAAALLPLERAPRSRIQIARETQPDRVHPVLAAAYEAYRDGNYRLAQERYREALERDPNSRNALLGLAALDVRQGRLEEAAGLYLRLLQLDPRDSVAQAALVNLGAESTPVASETRLKLLLEREPEAAHLHFSLGNLYASQSRWPEAERAYFNAYRTDRENADYALNLAVSLDHLNKSRAALRYYQRALELANKGQAGFDPASVGKRIKTLSNSSDD